MTTDVSTYTRTDSHVVYFFHAEVTWYTPGPDGSSYTGRIKCEHNHTAHALAQACAEQIRRQIERHPERFPEVARCLEVTR